MLSLQKTDSLNSHYVDLSPLTDWATRMIDGEIKRAKGVLAAYRSGNGRLGQVALNLCMRTAVILIIMPDLDDC